MTINVKRGDIAYRVYVHGRGFANGPVDIRSVGSRWITSTDGTKYNLDGYSDFGWKLYESEASYIAYRSKTDAWTRLRDILTNSSQPGEHVTIEIIESCIAALEKKP